MKSTMEILTKLQENSQKNHDEIFTRLYRYLLRPDIYFIAYQHLYSNKGAGTKGVNDDTADGFSEQYVTANIEALRTGSYEPKPVRRTYIQKKNGKLRPLGLPVFADKLVQEAIRMILEAIYEPIFSIYSHGFRPGRSCHTALAMIKHEFTGAKWFIEGDIKGCFDNIDHSTLIGVLNRKIKDARFLNLIRMFLKSGYMEDWDFHETYSGCPQGGIISPILANVYLNELDRYITQLKKEFDHGYNPRNFTEEYNAIRHKRDPRTDSCYITDDDEEMLEELTEELEGFLDITPEDVDEAVPRTRRTVNREKVTDHHAILPTRSMLQADLEALPKGEQNVLKLIIARTLMAVSKPFRYLETLLTTECAGEEFTAKGKEILEEGWKAVERKVLADILNRKQELTALPNAAENECGILNAELKEGQTSPPKHFTEDTLLHAMETASADSMPEGVERQGIGTPATRAATIEKLVQKGFLERKGTKKTKVLLPTDKGKALITVMPEEIQSPEMTADWETKLLQIERSEMEPETFMTEIKEMISSLVTTTEAAKGANALMKNKIIGVCPNCGKPVVEREKGWFCENRECRFVLWKDNAFFKRLGKHLDAHVADKLLRDGRVRLKDCKSVKGKTYNATVLLGTETDGRSKFSLEFENGGC